MFAGPPTLLFTDSLHDLVALGRHQVGDPVPEFLPYQIHGHVRVFHGVVKGSCGEAYNVADQSCDIMLKDLAKLIADYVGRRVIFEIPDAVEAAGYSKATKARLDSAKLQQLGWKAQFDIGTGIRHTIDIMREIQ